METLLVILGVLIYFLSPIATILFIILKLTNFVSWSWLWVLAPIWIVIIIKVMGYVASEIIDVIQERRKINKLLEEIDKPLVEK
jgi:hypothetical protein